MAKVEPLTATIDLGHRFVEAIVAHDWEAVAACFEPSAEFRAVVPNAQRPFREHTGGEAAAGQIQKWFGDADVTELMESEVDQIADRVRITYRIHEHEPDGWYDVEQVAFVTPGEAGFEQMNLVCSGFRPAG
ncbi:MAG TPA: hypothetical protein VK600_00680 [Candidatus Saccharimonadales bacterium]|nr:hypothetical protein [Candidatus Saccharimonadales bacterium]